MLLNCGVGEDSWESLGLQPVNPKGDQSWIFIGRTNVEAETPILWPPDVKNWLIWKDPDAGKDWRREEKGMTENEMVGWHHQLNGHEFEQPPGVDEGQGSLACCSPWVTKSQTWLSDWTELIDGKKWGKKRWRSLQTVTHWQAVIVQLCTAKQSSPRTYYILNHQALLPHFICKKTLWWRHCFPILLTRKPSFSQVSQKPNPLFASSSAAS